MAGLTGGIAVPGGPVQLGGARGEGEEGRHADKGLHKFNTFDEFDICTIILSYSF